MNISVIKNDKDKLWRFTPAAFLLAGLMPEYVAPFFTAVGFFAVLKQRIFQKKKPCFGEIGISIIVFIGWMAVSSFWSSSAITSLASIGLWLLMFSGFYFFTETIDSEEKIHNIMACGCISAGVAGAIGICQMVLYHIGDRFIEGLSNAFNPFWRFLNTLIEKLVFILPDFITSSMGSTTFHSFDTRACSTFSNPLFFATIELTLLPFAAYVFLFAKERRHRLIGFLCLLLSVGGIACSYSRGPYLFAVAVFFILFFYGGKETLKLLGVGGIGLGFVIVFASGTFKRLLTLLSGKDISVNTRWDIWGAAADMIKERPFFGYGTGFDNVRSMLHGVYGIKQPHAHNIFLEIWLENGIIGVILLAAIFFVFFISMVRLFRKGAEARRFAVTLFASVAGFFLCGMTDCVFYGLKPLQYMMMVLGLAQAVVTLYLKKKKTSEETTENEYTFNRQQLLDKRS